MKKCALFTILFGMALSSFIPFLSCEIGLGSSVDTQAPTVEIKCPPVDSIVKGRFAISGLWTDDGEISSVSVELVPTNLSDSKKSTAKTYSFKGKVFDSDDKLEGHRWFTEINPLDETNPIPDGSYEATVTIVDNVGHKSHQYRTFSIDNTAPFIFLNRPSTKAAETDKADTYGQQFVIKGSVADTSNIKLIRIKVYNHSPLSDDEEPDHIIDLKNVSKNINETVAQFEKDDYENDYAKIYYGLDSAEKKRERYFKLEVYDSAKTYPADGKFLSEVENQNSNNDFDDLTAGNCTKNFYLYNDIATGLLKIYNEDAVYKILNGSFDSSSVSRSTENNLPENPKEYVKNFLENKKIKVETGKFALNPVNNPTFRISALTALPKDVRYSDDYQNSISNNLKITTDISVGLDETPLIYDSIKFFLIPFDEFDSDGKPIYNNKKENRLYPLTCTTEIGSSYQIITTLNKDELVNSKGVPQTVNFGQHFVIGVEGIDEAQNEIITEDEALYIFKLTSTGAAPSLELSVSVNGSEFTNDSTLYVPRFKPEASIKQESEIILKGTVSVEEGIPDLTYILDKNPPVKIDVEPLADNKGVFTFEKKISVNDFPEKEKSGQHKIKIVAQQTQAYEEVKNFIYQVTAPEITLSRVAPTAYNYGNNEDGSKEQFELNGKLTDKKFLNGKNVKLNVSVIAGSLGLDESEQKSAKIDFIQKDENQKEVLKKTISCPTFGETDEIDTTEFENKELLIRITAYDKAGNKSVLEETFFVNQETDIPVILPKYSATNTLNMSAETVVSHENFKNVYSANQTVSFRLIDDDGLANVSYSLVGSGSLADYEKTGYFDSINGAGEYQYEINMPEEPGVYHLFITVNDVNANPKSKSADFYVRITAAAPVVKSVKFAKDPIGQNDKVSAQIDIRSDQAPFTLIRTVKQKSYDSNGIEVKTDVPQLKKIFTKKEIPELEKRNPVVKDEFDGFEKSGEYVVYYEVRDKNYIEEEPRFGSGDESIFVDLEAPTYGKISITSKGKTVNEGTENQKVWYKSSFIDIQLTDVKDENGSGVSKVEYTTDNEVSGTERTWNPMSFTEEKYCATVNCPNQGRNSISVRIIDVAGNVKYLLPVIAYIDTKEPVLNSSKVKYLQSGFQAISELLVNGKSEYQLLISASDDEMETAELNSGIASVAYNFGNYEPIEVAKPESQESSSWKITVPVQNGIDKYSDTKSNAIYVTIKDNAGNEIKERILTVTKDNKEPFVEIKTVTTPGTSTKVDNSLIDDVNGKIKISGSADDGNKLDSLLLEYQKAGEENWNQIELSDSSTLNNWNAEFDTTLLSDRTKYTIRATATDAAGNQKSFEKEIFVNQDTDRPVIMVTNPSSLADLENGAVKWESASISGTVSDDDAISYFGYFVGDKISYSASDYKEIEITNGIWKISGLEDCAKSVFFKVTAGEKDYFANENVIYNSETIFDATNKRGTYKLTDGTNNFGYYQKPLTEGSLASTKQNKLSLVIDTYAPDVETAEFSTDGGKNWKTGIGSQTFGGSKKSKLIIRQNAWDKNTVKSMTVKIVESVDGVDLPSPIFEKTYTAFEEDKKANGKTYLRFTSDEINLAGWNSTVNNGTESNSKRVEIIIDDGIKQTVSKIDLTVDNSAPEIKFSAPDFNSINSGEVTVYGTTTEIGDIYYTVSTDGFTKPSAKKKLTSWTGFTVFDDGSTTAKTGYINGEVFAPEYTKIPNAGVSWYVYFDGNTSDETRAHNVLLKNFAQTLSLTSDLAEFKDLVNFYIWIKVEDSVGNFEEYPYLVCVDPQGDRPSVSLSNPEKPGDSVGGTVKLYGSAEDTNGTVESVWLQLLSAKNGEGYGAVAPNSELKLSSFEPTEKDLNFWASIKDSEGKKAYTISKMKPDSSGNHKEWSGKLSGGEKASDYGIQANFSGTSWNLKINYKNEFDPDKEAKTANNMAVRVYACDNDKNLSYSLTRYFKMDRDTPVFSNIMLKQYKNQELFALQEARAGMYVKGKWYLEFTATDNEKLESLVLCDIDGVESSLPASSITKTDEKNWSVKYELPTEKGVGNYKRILKATDTTNHTGTYEIDINFDNESPKLLVDSSRDFDISASVHQSNGFYKLYSIVNDDSETGTSSGVKAVGFYFMRRKSSDEGLIFDPMQKRAEPISTKNLIYEDGLYWLSGEVSCDDSGKITLGSELAKYKTYVHSGSYIKLNGIMYKIESVNDDSITVVQSYEKVSSAKIALALFVDNRKSEYEASSSKNEQTGYYNSIKNDDNDGMVEELGGTTSQSTWQASIVSRNIPDGPIEIHYTAFDESMNYAVGMVGNKDFETYKKYTTAEVADFASTPVLRGNYASFVYSFSKENPAYISNNAPRLTGVTVAIDYTGTNKFENATQSKYYFKQDTVLINGKAEKRSVALTNSLVIKDDVKNSSNEVIGSRGVTTIKGKTWIIPEMVGGNGKLWYDYNIYASDQNGNKLSLRKSCSSNAVYFADGNDDYDEYEVKAGGQTYINSNLTKKNGEIAGIEHDTSIFENKNGNAGTGDTSLEQPFWFDYTIYDSTETQDLVVLDNESVSPEILANNQKANISIAMAVEVNDSTPPNTLISPLFWKSTSENSVYIESEKLKGHVELKDDLGTSELGALYGTDDDKVSGIVVFRGYAWDNKRLSKIEWAIMGENGSIQPADKLNDTFTIGASFSSSSASWTEYGTLGEARAENGRNHYKFRVKTAPKDEADSFNKNGDEAYLDEKGHKIAWELVIDTSSIKGFVAENAKLYVRAVDSNNQTTNLKSSSFATAKDNTQELKDKATNSPMYKVDILPYITGVKTALGNSLKTSIVDAYARTALGHYIVRNKETVIFEGYNLNDAKYVKSKGTGANADVLVDLSGNSKNQLETENIATSGDIMLKVGSLYTINNMNNNNAKGSYEKSISDSDSYKTLSTYAYNRKPNNKGNNLLTDDICFDVWEFDNDAAIPVSGELREPVMKINPVTGKIGFAFVSGPADFAMPNGRGTDNDDVSYTVFQHNYATFSNIGLCYDNLGYSYGVATGLDTYPNGNKNTLAGRFTFQTSRWGVSSTTEMNDNYNYERKLRLEAIGLPGDSECYVKGNYPNKYTMTETRFYSPSIVATTHRNNTSVYLAYYDSIQNQIRFRYGKNVSGSKNDFDNFVDNEGLNIDLRSHKGDNNNDNRKYVFEANTNNFSLIAGADWQNVRVQANENTGHTKKVGNNYFYDTGYSASKYVAIDAIQGTSAETDVVVAVWYDGQNCRYAYTTNPTSGNDNGIEGGWTGNKVIFSGGGEYCAIKVGPNGSVHIAANVDGELKYAYLNSYDAAYSEATDCVTVDSYAITGEKITLDVGQKAFVNDGRTYYAVVPYISYYLNSAKLPAIASLVIPKNGVMNYKAQGTDESNNFTGNWEISLVPVQEKLTDSVVDKINIALWKKNVGTGNNAVNGVITGCTDDVFASKARTMADNTFVNNNGYCSGNGTENPVIGFAIITDSGTALEIAQKK
ncbi:MAG: hypothetical protein J6X84_02085 [Treponema sp.]|nr:hypothetical protein [Treponema sp.]